MTSSYHVGCFKVPRKFNKMPVAEFVDDYIEDDSGAILPDKLDEIVAKLEAASKVRF